MKVALIHLRHSGTGGTERYLNQLAAHLASAGHDVRIVCRSHEAPPHPAVRFEVLRGFALGSGARLLAFGRAVERHVRGSDYDLVVGLGKTWTHDVVRLGGGCHATYLELAHRATLDTGWRRRLPTSKHRLALEVERKALAPGAYLRVITNSEMVKRDVMERYATPPERIRVVYNGVDLQRFHPALRAAEGARLRADCGFAERDFVLLFLGTGYGRKGLDRALEGFARLAGARPELRLLVVGYDSARRRYEAEATRLGLGERTRFLGGRRDAEACYAAGDLYLLPTRYDPFANATLEALASGLPVLTTRTNGAAELLVGGAAGSVVDDADAPAAWAAAIDAWSRPERARAAGVAARALAEAHAEARTMRESTEVLEEALREKRARAGEANG